MPTKQLCVLPHRKKNRRENHEVFSNMVPFKKYMVPLSFSNKHIYYIWYHSKNGDSFKVFNGRFSPTKNHGENFQFPSTNSWNSHAQALYPPLPMPCGRKLEVEICFKKGRKKTNSFFMVTRRGCFFLFWEGITVFKSFVYCILFKEAPKKQKQKKRSRVVLRVEKTCYFCLSSET